MDVRVIDLDGGLLSHQAVLRRCGPGVFPLQHWGPRVRMGCSFRRFRRFEEALAGFLGGDEDRRPCVTLYGSGDFHHVSLALVRRQPRPFNLLVLDNHPDWMRGIPFLHCGTWLYHAARLPAVRRVFHVGGDVDFDNSWRWLAPWPLVRSGKITVLPARRPYRRGPWRKIVHKQVRIDPSLPASAARFAELVAPFRAELSNLPLYVSVDKDVIGADESVVNWDSGHLTLTEVTGVLEAFAGAARGVAGIDVLGDWSPVQMQGLFRKLLHVTEHPGLTVDAREATRLNERTNETLMQACERLSAVSKGSGQVRRAG